ncbi:carbohydrate ABC transporter substrate-binding protein, CUT1 family [Streptomyces sp. DvalAA-14]|uniref:ABC transporter substrate-binding protein n=1 Tax=unclassified Streptomyces TaxID=2593676 RepID=UPI00081B1D02|nr:MULTISPECIES: sugar ABC transporter substrate-binding protein [unclassified Streptomyces]MYS19253.1 extracellular solute-binding protein [Streptomyces sp. SID4948]SCD40344.1 carbohydrate ABC transporter substrate-binding protein, CUT1 family [Streptomyces sp. DvalAA-14]
MRTSSTSSRLLAATALVAALGLTLSACGGGSDKSSDKSSSDPGSLKGQTITYWASNQGTSLDNDKQVLTPELNKFTQQTGIKVKLEVVGWADLLNRILAATTSGQGPDVLNIGNTWSASLQATGALLPWDAANFAKIGGKDRFAPAAIASAGAAGQDPAAVPIYSMAYGLYYNKKMFADAGLTPPKTWDQLVSDGKALTKDGHYGLAVEGGNGSENIHHAFVLAKQRGSSWFDASGKATFDTPQNVAAVKQYVDFIASDKIAAKGDAEYAQNQTITDFATGKAAMMMWQSAATSIKAHGMTPDQYGVVPVPTQTEGATGDAGVTSMVAGINVAVFKNSKHQDAAVQLVKFLTSTPEQKILNGTYGSLPPVKEAQSDPAFQTPDLKVLAGVLGSSAAPLPQVPNESQFETLVGTAVKNLFADAAAGKAVTDSSVKTELTKAQQQMPAS